MDDAVDGPTPPEGAAIRRDVPPLPPEVSSGQEELRRLVEAGAGTPEELRELAARLREQRALEEALWRREVKPALLESKKRRFHIGDLRDRPEAVEGSSGLGIGLGLLAGVAVILLAATQGSVLFMLVPVIGVLVYAYVQGKREAAPPAAGTPPEPGDEGVGTLGP